MRHIEEQHQIALIAWCNHQRLSELKHPVESGTTIGDLIYAIPNGGFRNAKEGARLKRGGVKAGIPDLCLPLSCGGFNSLYIEMKKPIIKGQSKPTTTKNQDEMMLKLRKAGNLCVVCYGLDQAREVIVKYLKHELEYTD